MLRPSLEALRAGDALLEWKVMLGRVDEAVCHSARVWPSHGCRPALLAGRSAPQCLAHIARDVLFDYAQCR